jgi:tetratricopeptide (TPR) repeat protein
MQVDQLYYDFFFSYKRKDASQFVGELAGAIQDRGYGVWFDEFEIKPGDSITASIERGLSNSLIVVLFLTQNYFEGWSEQERRSAFNLFVSQKTRLVPLWLEIDSAYVSQKAPFLSDLAAIVIDAVKPSTVEDVCKKLENLIKISQLYIEKTETETHYVFTPKQSSQKGFAAYEDSGLEKMKSGDYEGALADFKQAKRLRQKEGDSVQSIDLLINTLSGNIQDARIELPKDAWDYSNSGTEKGKSGDYKGAISDFNQAIQRNPSLDRAYVGRSLAKDSLGDKNGAIDDLDQAIQLNPNDAFRFYRRGLIKAELGDQRGALSDFSQAIKLDINNADCYLKRASIKNTLGDKIGAIADLDRVIQLDSSNATVYEARGLLKHNLGDNNGAILDYNQVLKIKPDYADAYNNRGVIKYNLGDQSGALSDFLEAAKFYQLYGNTEGFQENQKRIRDLGASR